MICKEAVAGADGISCCLARRAEETAKPHPTETTSRTKLVAGTSWIQVRILTDAVATGSVYATSLQQKMALQRRQTITPFQLNTMTCPKSSRLELANCRTEPKNGHSSDYQRRRNILLRECQQRHPSILPGVFCHWLGRNQCLPSTFISQLYY